MSFLRGNFALQSKIFEWGCYLSAACLAIGLLALLISWGGLGWWLVLVGSVSLVACLVWLVASVAYDCFFR